MQWKVMQEEERVDVQLHLLEQAVMVQADIVRVQQIMTNLFTNAKQAMDNGTITITVMDQGATLAIVVKDTGDGIPLEDQAFIFERFYRGENKKYTIRGLGLGLPLSKMMAQSIGGDLRLIESDISGTCFEFVLQKATTL